MMTPVEVVSLLTRFMFTGCEGPLNSFFPFPRTIGQVSSRIGRRDSDQAVADKALSFPEDNIRTFLPFHLLQLVNVAQFVAVVPVEFCQAPG